MNLKQSIYRMMPSILKKRMDERYKKKSLKNTFFKAYQEYVNSSEIVNIDFNTFVNAYCLCGGEWFDEISAKITSAHPKKIFEPVDGVLGKITKNASETINTTLEKNGYYSFKEKLSNTQIESLRNFATTNMSYVRGEDQGYIFDEFNPKSEVYRFKANDVMQDATVQELITDPTLISVARQYLGCEPIFDFVDLWWSSTYNKEASSDAAQLYHFDLERIKWLKIFVYIYDVDENHGPHYYIKGSHQSGVKTKEVLSRGYVRVVDSEIHQIHGKENEKMMLGVAGSIFAGDTKCWHKGSVLKEGKRLVLEFQYTNSLFGAELDSLKVKTYSEKFKAFCEQNPRYSARIKFE